jgi:esterase/lipase
MGIVQTKATWTDVIDMTEKPKFPLCSKVGAKRSPRTNRLWEFPSLSINVAFSPEEMFIIEQILSKAFEDGKNEATPPIREANIAMLESRVEEKMERIVQLEKELRTAREQIEIMHTGGMTACGKCKTLVKLKEKHVCYEKVSK